MTLADFDVEGRIGDGSFSEVLQVCAGPAPPLRIVVQQPQRNKLSPVLTCCSGGKLACGLSAIGLNKQRHDGTSVPVVTRGEHVKDGESPLPSGNGVVVAQLAVLHPSSCCASPQVRHKVSRRVYALKVVDKHLVLRHRLVGQLRQERNILDRCCHPGIARLHFTFQDAAAVYLGLELCPNGPPPVLVVPTAAGNPCESSLWA